MTTTTVDAVVIGAGPNGLAAANLLADAGWDALVLEAADEPGGAVRTAELIEPGFRSDLFSSFYPLGAASPILRGLHLERHGLRWVHAPAVVAHVLPDDQCAVLSRDLDETVASVASFAPTDGDAWRREFAMWRRIREDLLDSLFTPFPPVRPGARLARKLGVAEALRMARMLTMPTRTLAEERFTGDGARLLLSGNALHSDLGTGQAGSAVFGWLLCMLAQDVGFSVPKGGAGELTAALVRRLTARGGRVECGREVTKVLIARGRAVGVTDSGGAQVRTRHAVLATLPAPPCTSEWWWTPSTYRCACSTTYGTSTGPTAPSRSTGRCRGPSRGTTRRPARPAPFTWPPMSTASPTSARRWPAAACRTAPSSCSAR